MALSLHECAGPASLAASKQEDSIANVIPEVNLGILQRAGEPIPVERANIRTVTSLRD